MESVNQYIQDIANTINYLPLDQIDSVIELLHEARLNQQQVFIMGNGGSAATASHFVCDLMKNTRVTGTPNFRVIGLNDNLATLTAMANDEGYENVFALQIASLVRPRDLVIAFSTSGNSPNVLEGVRVANEMGAYTLGFTGKDGGKLSGMVHFNVHVINTRADQIEDVHMIVSHMVTATLRELASPTLVAVDQQPAYLFPETVEPFSMPQALIPSTGQPGSIASTNHLSADPAGLEAAGSAYNARREPGSLGEMLDYLAGIGEDARAIFEENGRLDRILCLIVDNLQASSGSIAILNSDSTVINAATIFEGKVQSVDCALLDQLMNHGLAGWVKENRKSVLIASTRQDDRWVKGPRAEGGRSVISVPLTVQDQVIGVVTVTRPEDHPFDMKDLLILIGVVAALTAPLQSGRMQAGKAEAVRGAAQPRGSSQRASTAAANEA